MKIFLHSLKKINLKPLNKKFWHYFADLTEMVMVLLHNKNFSLIFYQEKLRKNNKIRIFYNNNNIWELQVF